MDKILRGEQDLFYILSIQNLKIYQDFTVFQNKSYMRNDLKRRGIISYQFCSK
jgi:hypothetical protein